MKMDGTEAKDIAIHFFDMTNQRATPAIYSKTIIIAKSIMEAGYKKDEIFEAIDHLVAEGVEMYSLGYLSTCINDVLWKINRNKEKEKSYKVKNDMSEHLQEQRKKGNAYEINTNNRSKRKRTGLQSEFREKFNFHMPAKSR